MFTTFFLTSWFCTFFWLLFPIFDNIINFKCIILSFFFTILSQKRISTILKQVFYFLRAYFVNFLSTCIFCIIERTFLKQRLLHSELFAGSVKHLLLICFCRNETIHTNFKYLANSMCSSNCLQIVLRVPIRVENDYYSSFGQVDSKATSSSREEENSELIVFIKSLDCCNSILAFHTTGQNFIANLFQLEVFGYNVNHSFELGEYEHFVILFFIFVNKFIQKDQFS